MRQSFRTVPDGYRAHYTWIVLREYDGRVKCLLHVSRIGSESKFNYAFFFRNSDIVKS